MRGCPCARSMSRSPRSGCGYCGTAWAGCSTTWCACPSLRAVRVWRGCRGPTTLHWLTLEACQSGFVLTLHVESHGGDGHREDEARILIQVLAEDDLAQRYPFRGGGANGGRQELQFVPALDPRARELRVTLESMHKLYPRPPLRPPTLPRQEAISEEPWTFIFQLGTAGLSGSSG